MYAPLSVSAFLPEKPAWNKFWCIWIFWHLIFPLVWPPNSIPYQSTRLPIEVISQAWRWLLDMNDWKTRWNNIPFSCVLKWQFITVTKGSPVSDPPELTWLSLCTPLSVLIAKQLSTWIPSHAPLIKNAAPGSPRKSETWHWKKLKSRQPISAPLVKNP